MEVKAWEYEEFPAFDDEGADATWLDTTGDEPGTRYVPNVEYQNVGGVPRVLQILIPNSRNAKAPKEEIADAVEKLFNVHVVKVNTMWVKPKTKRVRYVAGKTRTWKKAIVTLAEGESIEVFAQKAAAEE